MSFSFLMGSCVSESEGLYHKLIKINSNIAHLIEVLDQQHQQSENKFINECLDIDYIFRSELNNIKNSEAFKNFMKAKTKEINDESAFSYNVFVDCYIEPIKSIRVRADIISMVTVKYLKESVVNLLKQTKTQISYDALENLLKDGKLFYGKTILKDKCIVDLKYDGQSITR